MAAAVYRDDGTKVADCPGCNEHTIHERTTGCELPAEVEGPVNDSPVWLCRMCHYVSPRIHRPTRQERLITSLLPKQD